MADKRHIGRLHPRRKRDHPHDRYLKGAVYEQRIVYGMQADQAPSAKSILTDPKIVNALHAVSFHCRHFDLPALLEEFWNVGRAELNREGLSEGLFEKLTSQEQADMVAVGFVDKMAADVMHRTGVGLSKNHTQHNVQDLLSLATVAAAFLQVLLELLQMCLHHSNIYVASRVTMPCLQVASDELVDICYATQIGWSLAMATSVCKKLVCYCCGR